MPDATYITGMTDFQPLNLRTHPKVLFAPVILTLLGLAVMVAAAVLVPTFTTVAWALPAVLGAVLLFLVVTAGVPYLRWRTGTFHIDREKISVRVGLLYRKTTEIPIFRLTQVSCEQGIVDRLWRCGTLVLADASAMQGGARFHDIPHVRLIQDQLNNLIYERQNPQPTPVNQVFTQQAPGRREAPAVDQAAAWKGLGA